MLGARITGRCSSSERRMESLGKRRDRSAGKSAAPPAKLNAPAPVTSRIALEQRFAGDDDRQRSARWDRTLFRQDPSTLASGPVASELGPSLDARASDDEQQHETRLLLSGRAAVP